MAKSRFYKGPTMMGNPPVKRAPRGQSGHKGPRLHPKRKSGAVDIRGSFGDKLTREQARKAANDINQSVRYEDPNRGTTVLGPDQSELPFDQRASWNQGLPDGVAFDTPKERREYDAENLERRRRIEAYRTSPEGMQYVQDARDMVKRYPHMSGSFLEDPLLADDPILRGVQGSNPMSPQERDTEQWLRKRDDFVFELTTKQRAELRKLANGLAHAMASDDFSDEEKVELRRQYLAKLAGVKPIEQLRPQTPAEMFKAKTFTHPQTGTIYPLDETGTPGRPIYEPPSKQPTFQDRHKAVQEAMGYAFNPETGDIDRDKYQFIMQQMGFGGEQGEQGEQGRRFNALQRTMIDSQLRAQGKQDYVREVVVPRVQTREGFMAFIRSPDYHLLTLREEQYLAKFAERKGYLDE